jgi:hypothetical protein
VGAPLFGLCGGLVYDAEAGRPAGGVFLFPVLVVLSGGPLFGVGCLTAVLTGQIAGGRQGPISASLTGAGIGTVLVSAGTALLRGFGAYVTDGAYALDMGLRRAPTLWALAASLAAGGLTGAIVGMAAGRPQASDEWGRAGTIFVLLLMLAGLIHFALWEVQTLYELPSIY